MIKQFRSRSTGVVIFAATLCLSVGLSTATGQEARQITHVFNDAPSFAPDGRHMVYISMVAGREQLFTSTLEAREVRQITYDDANHEDPAWSPDGQWIAFTYLTGQVEQIARVSATGGTMELLTSASERTIHPNWSPDSRRLAFCTDDDLAPPKKNDSDIKVIDLQTHETKVLITGGTNTYPVWSPDGRSLAFRRMVGEHDSEVFLADADGSHARNLTRHPAFDGWPAWSPDGRWLAFASNRDDHGGSGELRGDYRIFVMRADGTDLRLLAQTTGRGTAPQWTRDGKTVYFPISHKTGAGFDCEIFAADFTPSSGGS